MSDIIITIEMTEKQLATVISGLLFSCSVNVVSSTNEEYQRELFNLACLLKSIKPDIQLSDVQFLKEDHYEDSLSADVIKQFETNIELIKIDEL